MGEDRMKEGVTSGANPKIESLSQKD